MMNINTKTVFSISLVLGLLFTNNCSPTFEDESKSIVKKPEVLSIVLEPPQASPGDSVTASFLAADQYGALELSSDPANLTQAWILLEGSDFAGTSVDKGEVKDDSGETEEEATPSGGFGILPEFAFQVPSEENFTFNNDNLAPLLAGLMIIPDGFELDLDKPEESFAAISDLMDSGEATLNLRTLIVSKSSASNQNPRIVKVTARIGEDGQEQEIPFHVSHQSEIATTRSKAAGNPFVFKYNKDSDLWFNITVEDEGDIEEEIRYQWISTAGAFKGFPIEERKWSPPEFVKPEGDFTDQSAQDVVDPRTDPNLYPIWVVIRDNGIANQLGQSWAEFYVRITQ